MFFCFCFCFQYYVQFCAVYLHVHHHSLVDIVPVLVKWSPVGDQYLVGFNNHQLILYNVEVSFTFHEQELCSIHNYMYVDAKCLTCNSYVCGFQFLFSYDFVFFFFVLSRLVRLFKSLLLGSPSIA